MIKNSIVIMGIAYKYLINSIVENIAVNHIPNVILYINANNFANSSTNGGIIRIWPHTLNNEYVTTPIPIVKKIESAVYLTLK